MCRPDTVLSHSAAAWGMLRCAAVEHSGQPWQGVDSSPHRPASVSSFNPDMASACIDATTLHAVALQQICVELSRHLWLPHGCTHPMHRSKHCCWVLVYLLVRERMVLWRAGRWSGDGQCWRGHSGWRCQACLPPAEVSSAAPLWTAPAGAQPQRLLQQPGCTCTASSDSRP